MNQIDDIDIDNLVLCMVKKIGQHTYRFFFQDEDIAPDFYGDDFEQKPASICNDLEPDENSFKVSYTAESPEVNDYETSEFSNLYSMQDGLDMCVALMFDRSYEDENSGDGRLVLSFNENILDVSDKLFKFGFRLSDDFPQREPTDFITAKLKEIDKKNPSDLVLCRVKLHDKMEIRDGVTSYEYDMFYIKRNRINEFRSYDEWFNRRETQLYHADYEGFVFDKKETYMCTNVALDTIEDQNDYSMVECIDGCVCLVCENIDGKEYPPLRLVLKFGDSYDEVRKKCKEKELSEEKG